MKCEILTADHAAVIGCEFEYWNSDRREMACCGKTPVATVSGHAFCIECLPDALIRCESGTYLSAPSGTVPQHQFATKEDFLSEAQQVAKKRMPVTV